MTEEKPKILIQYDKLNYSEDQMTEIEAELSEYFTVEKTTVLRFGTEPSAVFLILLLVSSLSFFTRIGENLADAVSEDLVQGYKKMKQRIARIITRPVSKDIPTVIFQIPILENQRPVYDRGIKGIIKTDDETLLSECFDRVEELYHIAQKIIEQLGNDRDIVQITFQYNVQTKSWEPQWCTKAGHIMLRYENGKWEPMK
jgi:hypothetical protein